MARAFALRGGFYDVFRVAELHAELELIEPHRDIVLDLATTEHLDCACLGLLVRNLGTWRKRWPQTNLHLQNVVPSVARVLALTDLDQLFIVENIVSQADPPESADVLSRSSR